MFKLDKKPETLIEAIDRYWFLVDNGKSVKTRGSSSLKNGLTDLATQCGNIKLSDTNGIKTALSKFFNLKGNILVYNERFFAGNNLFNWLLEKGYIKEDPSRNYVPVA